MSERRVARVLVPKEDFTPFGGPLTRLGFNSPTLRSLGTGNIVYTEGRSKVGLMANVLKREKQEMAISALVEGASIRSTERMTGVHRDTIMRLMLRVGDGCEALMDSELRNLGCRRIQVDELWGFVQKKTASRPGKRGLEPGSATSGRLSPSTPIPSWCRHSASGSATVAPHGISCRMWLPALRAGFRFRLTPSQPT